MSRGGWRRVVCLLGSAVLLVLACAPARITDDRSTSTGSAGDGGATTGTGSSEIGGTSTGATSQPCEPFQLADIAAGIGGFAIDGEAEDDHAGGSLSGLGDIDGDGLADLLLGARAASPNGLRRAGRAYLVFGKADTEAISLADVADGSGGFAIDGEAEDDHSGELSGAGDIDGDGRPDVIVAAVGADPNGPYSGRTYVVLGKADTTPVALGDVAQGIGGFAMDGEAEDDQSGVTVTAPGDTNGDGLADVAVGTGQARRSYVVFGTASTDAVSLADVAGGIGGYAIDGETEGDWYGGSVSAPGDVNGDGLADVAVDTKTADAGGVGGSGRTYVVFGKTDTSTVALADVAVGIGGFAIDGEQSEAAAGWSGFSANGAGDVNGDGLADIIVGAPWSDSNGTFSGRAYVVFGKAETEKVLLADVADGIGGFAMDGGAERGGAGSSVSGAGDVNGDGLADVIVAAENADPNGPYSGRTYVVFGKASTERLSLADVAHGIGGFALDGESEYDWSGKRVSGAGDVNGDGLADIMVGAWSAAPTGLTNAGRTYVVFGGDLSCEGGG